MFRVVRSANQLARAEGATWFQRGDFAAWSIGRDRVGWVLWGHVGADAAEEGKQIWIAIARRLPRPYDLVLDLRPLDSVSQGAFERIREFAVTPKPGLRRHAILVGDAQPGTVQLGLYSLAPPSHEWRAFRTTNEAAAWLGWPDAAQVLAAVDARLADHLAEAPIVSSVRQHLSAQLQRGHVSDVVQTSHALGVSSRALQRALMSAGTSFSRQLDQARVAHACRLLSEPSAKLEAVTRAIGFQDAKSLVRLFRRVKGESPSEFRDRLHDRNR